MDRLLILFSTLPALLQPAIPALQGIIEVAKKPTDRDGPYRRYLSVVQSMSTAILQRAKEVNLEAFVLGHVGLGRLARAPESLERAARRRLGDLAPLAKEANALLTLIETTTHDIKATHTFLQPLTNFDVTDAPYSLLVHTGKRDSVSATIGGLKDFAKRWELITNTYGTLLGRAPGDGQLTRLSQGSLIAGIVVALPVLLTVLEIVHTALEILKGFNDIKLQRLKF